MPSSAKHPTLQKYLRYLSAYTLFVVFILLGLLITWALRSDVFVLCTLLSLPYWLIDIIYTWGTFVIFIPYILIVAALESYLNAAAAKSQVRERAMKIFIIEGGIGLFVFALMGILALLGYPPSL
ncbi:MAG: hypothetical protein IH586_08940 [Anaerolineaceae bacterium]|nr:hypothetical protein [Anaerolineaceae bacterium]